MHIPALFMSLIALVGMLPNGPLTAADPIITTIVGGGSGDGQPATASGFPSPLRSAVDADGNIYFSDNSMRRVYKIEAGTGILRLFAGNGSTGNSGLEGPALDANITQPSGIACDTLGNVYISDRGVRGTGPARILKVNSAGIITRVAGSIDELQLIGSAGDGGPAVDAFLHFPTGITVHGTDLYIADQGNQRIRKIDENGIISTVAGTGVAGFNNDGIAATAAWLYEPNAVDFDSAGNMYISDERNSRIRKVEIDTMTDTFTTISTVVGVGTFGFSGDGGLATAAELSWPGDIKVDQDDNLYIADAQNRRLRQVVGTTITTIVGDFGVPLGGNVGGPASNLNLGAFYSVNVLADGDELLITDVSSKRIWHIDRINDVTSSVAGGFRPQGINATSIHPGNLTDVAFDRDGNAYLTDYINHCVLRLTNGLLSVVAGNGLQEISGDGGTAIDAGVRNPESVVVDGRYLYIAAPARIWRADLQTGLIAAYAGTGNLGNTGDGGPALAATMGNVRGLVINNAGDLFLVDNSHGTVRKITRATGIIERIAGNDSGSTSGDGGLALDAGIDDVRDLALLPNGNLVIADLTAGLRHIDMQTGIITSVGTLTTARGMVIDGDGHCYVSSLHRIFRVTTDTWSETEIAGEVANGFTGDGGPAIDARLDTPHGMAIDADGHLHIADMTNKRIREVDTTLTPPTNLGGRNHGGSGGGGGGGCGLGSGAATLLLLSSWLVLLRLRRTRQQF